MIRSARFWIPMMVFQVVFGLAVFAITRQYYAPESNKVGVDPAVMPLPLWPNDLTEATLAQLQSSKSSGAIFDDPVEISRQADEFFINKQYQRAAELYGQLLVLGPDNVDTYNNLGLTLHYLGRSTEALDKLSKGVTVDPTYQRIWLTLGFVNSQLGNIEQARAALTTAAQIETDNEIGQSALRMIEDLQ